MSTPLLARTALSAAVTAALVSAPATIGAPAFGTVADSVIGGSGSVASPTTTELPEPTDSPLPSESPDDDGTEDPQTDPDDDGTHGPQQDEESELPDGSFDVRAALPRDTFALYDDGELFDAQDEDFDHGDIEIPLTDPRGAPRTFVLTDDEAALDLVTAENPEGEDYHPAANGEGDRTFTFDVSGGDIGEVSETTDDDSPSPTPTGTQDPEESQDPEETEDPEEPTPDPEPTDDPTGDPSQDPDPTPEPTPDPTEDPAPPPTDDPDDGDDRDDGGDSGDDTGPQDDGSDEDSDERDDVLEDPSTGNGSDDGRSDRPRETVPSGDGDWVPTGPQRPDYSDPVPQPPGADGDDSITPDDEDTQPQAEGGGDDPDDLATDSASDEDGDGGLPWQIGVVVAIGAAAIGFILFTASRRRGE